jgi:transcriptional regulator with PAS, ATPase and Fis domain
MSPLLQSRLLRVLQEKEVRRVGDNVPSFVDVRVVAAANESLEQRVKEGTFREDLYYRLNVIQVELPPLRERKDDIPLLAAHFLNRRQRPGCEPFRVTKPVMDFLVGWNWPGNVRELENVMERAAALCETTLIKLEDLPPSLVKKAGMNASDDQGAEVTALPSISDTSFTQSKGSQTSTGSSGLPPANGAKGAESIKPLKTYLREQEQAYLNRAMESAGGDKEQAAILLGVSLATLYRKLSGDEAG